MPTQPDDDFTELVDARIDRVDAVDKAANGLPFLIAKSADAGGAPVGLLDPALVRDLIGKAEPASPPPVPGGGIHLHLTGDPDDIARYITRTTEAASRQGGVIKVADEMDEPGGLDPTVALAEPEESAPGSPTDPGSPAWEAIDAATARKWTSILSRAQRAITLLAERELIEAAGADPDDAMNAFDLEDAACAVEYAIGVLAPFAVAEEAEADCGAEQMGGVRKALTGDTGVLEALETIEALAPVTKAGRTLSAANETAIREAVQSLTKVLASLPAAPTTTDDSGQTVAKEAPMATEAAIEPTTDAPAEPVGKADAPAPDGGQSAVAEPVTKADDEKPPAIAVYDANGNLVGIADPSNITPIAGAKAPEPAAADEPAPAADPAAAPDMTPAPAAAVGTPADGVAKTDDITTPDGVLKSSIATMIKSVLDEHSATQKEAAAEQAVVLKGLADAVDVLKDQVTKLEEQPAVPQVFSGPGSGPVPPQQHLRGQSHGTAAVDVAKAAQLRQGLYAPTAAERTATANTMQQQAIDALSAIHSQPRRP